MVFRITGGQSPVRTLGNFSTWPTGPGLGTISQREEEALNGLPGLEINSFPLISSLDDTPTAVSAAQLPLPGSLHTAWCQVSGWGLAALGKQSLSPESPSGRSVEGGTPRNTGQLSAIQSAGNKGLPYGFCKMVLACVQIQRLRPMASLARHREASGGEFSPVLQLSYRGCCGPPGMRCLSPYPGHTLPIPWGGSILIILPKESQPTSLSPTPGTNQSH